jgi:hypothetical protein
MNFLDAEELEEIMMEEESDEELEELSEFIEPTEIISPPSSLSSSSSSSSSLSNEVEEREIRFRDRRPEDSLKVLDFTSPPSGINSSAASNINAQSSPFSFLFSSSSKYFKSFLEETNRYFHQFMAYQDAPGPSVQTPDVTIKETHKFLAIIVQIGHDQRDSLKDYWSRDEQYYTRTLV